MGASNGLARASTPKISPNFDRAIDSRSPESEYLRTRAAKHGSVPNHWHNQNLQSMEEFMAKAQDAKKETKKKPEKTLKEKRLEKAAKKAAK